MEGAYVKVRLPARIAPGRRGRQMFTSLRSKGAGMLGPRGKRLLRPRGEEDVGLVVGEVRMRGGGGKL